MKQFYQKVCALLLVISLLSGGAGALNRVETDRFTDFEQAHNQEAIALMADLGILEGKGDGSFDPTGTVNRAAMAKLIYGVLLGSADPASFAVVKTDLTDIKDHWGENYIKYCYDVGILSGIGQGKFDPDGVVNVASAAKMLLVALGYDPIERGYTSNPFWSDNIMTDARRAGLLEGIGQFSFEPLTRDNGARMVYNALFSPIYVPQYGLKGGEQTIVSYQTRPTTLGLESYGLVKMMVRIGGVTPGLGAPIVNYVGTYPAARRVSNRDEIMSRVRTEFSYRAELAGREATMYVKASWTLDEDSASIEQLKLEDLYSREVFLQD